MNNLKKTLLRDDVKKYQNKKNNNSFKPSKTSSHWTDINQLIECRFTLKKNVECSIYECFKKIMEESFQNGSIKNFQNFLVKLIQKYEFYYPVDHEENLNMSKIHNQYLKKICQILEVLQRMLQKEESSNLKVYLKICYGQIDKYLKDITKKRKNRQLQDYQKIISILKPTKKKQTDHNKDNQKNLKKLISSLSSNNLHVKVTQEEFSIKNPQLSKKKSQGALKSYSKSKDSNSTKNLNEGQLKLQNFLKDPSIKLVKTKIEYDYSAILEGSRSNIHPRNKTCIQPTQSTYKKKQKIEVTNMNKAKKNQAFVFYRPKEKH